MPKPNASKGLQLVLPQKILPHLYLRWRATFSCELQKWWYQVLSDPGLSESGMSGGRSGSRKGSIHVQFMQKRWSQSTLPPAAGRRLCTSPSPGCWTAQAGLSLSEKSSGCSRCCHLVRRCSPCSCCCWGNALQLSIHRNRQRTIGDHTQAEQWSLHSWGCFLQLNE